MNSTSEITTFAEDGTALIHSISKRRNFTGKLILIALTIASIGNGFLCPYSLFTQTTPLYLTSIGLIFSSICMSAVLVSLTDFHPLKRVTLFLVVPVLLFGSCFALGIEIGRFVQVMGPPFRWLTNWLLLVPATCVSVAWISWLLRVFRGWRIVPHQEPIRSTTTSPTKGRTPELLSLGITIGLSHLLLLIGHSQAAMPVMLASGGMVAIIVVAPATFWMLRSRCLGLLWLVFSFGPPGLALAGFILFQFDHFWQSGILLTFEAWPVSAILLAAALPFATFLFALRMIGLRLIYSEPWKQQAESAAAVSKLHPLDEQ